MTYPTGQLVLGMSTQRVFCSECGSRLDGTTSSVRCTTAGSPPDPGQKRVYWQGSVPLTATCIATKEHLAIHENQLAIDSYHLNGTDERVPCSGRSVPFQQDEQQENASSDTGAPQTTQPCSMSASRIESFTTRDSPHSEQTKVNSSLFPRLIDGGTTSSMDKLCPSRSGRRRPVHGPWSRYPPAISEST